MFILGIDISQGLQQETQRWNSDRDWVSVQGRHPIARVATSVLAPHGCQTLHYTSPMWQSPHGRNSITHLTLIVLSLHNSIALGCNAVQ